MCSRALLLFVSIRIAWKKFARALYGFIPNSFEVYLVIRMCMEHILSQIHIRGETRLRFCYRSILGPFCQVWLSAFFYSFDKTKAVAFSRWSPVPFLFFVNFLAAAFFVTAAREIWNRETRLAITIASTPFHVLNHSTFIPVTHSTLRWEILLRRREARKGSLHQTRIEVVSFSLIFQVQIVLPLCSMAREACGVYAGHKTRKRRCSKIQRLPFRLNASNCLF